MADWKAIDRARRGMAAHDRTRLGERAFERGWISRAQLEETLPVADADPAGQARALVERGLLKPAQAEELLAELRRQDLQPTVEPIGGELPEEARRSAGDPDRVVGRYLLVEEIGRGGMGTVWRAWDPGPGRWVALKILRDEVSASVRDRFLREVHVAAGLRHPHLVTVFDAGEWRGRYYLAMELVTGGPMDVDAPLRSTVALLAKVARGVDEAHRWGIVHRDLKPGNIMIDEAGEPRVVDFGLAHQPDSGTDLTRTGSALGTPAYMAPEQIRGEKAAIGPATDVYALGAILYEAAAGRTPHYGATPMDLFRQALDQEPVPPGRVNAGVPRDIDTIALKALEKLPGRRYASAGAFADDLERHLRGEPISAQPLGAGARLWRSGVRHRRALLPVVAAAAIAGVSVAWALHVASERDTKVREAREEAARREAADAEAWKRLEVARPSIDKAFRAVYDRKVDVASVKTGLAGARTIIEQTLEKSPRLALGHYLLGRAQELLGEEGAAEAAWRRSIELDPDFGPARARLGELLLFRAFAEALIGGDLPEPGKPAGAEIEGLLKAAAGGRGFDDDLPLEALRAMLAYLRRDADEVRAVCREAIDRFDGREGSEIFHWLAALMGPREQQVQALGRAIEIRPTFAWAYFSRASAARSEADYSKAIELRPRFPEAFYMRGNLRASAGDLPRAIEDYTEALRLRPDFAGCHNNRGIARLSRREWEEAASDFGHAIRLAPGEAKFHANRGAANAALGRFDAALADFTEAIRLKPGHADYHSGRGNVNADRKSFEAAEADYAEAIRLDPGDPDPFSARGVLFRGLGRTAAALADFERALELAPPGWPSRDFVEQALRELRGEH